MTKAEFIRAVGLKVRDSPVQDHLVQTCLKQPEFISVLLENMVSTHENATYFGRILELVMKSNSTPILPYLDQFCITLQLAKEDATIRSCAKICELLMVQYELKKVASYRELMLPAHHEAMISACFDWKITAKATAIQAHAMYALYLLGFSYSWVHPELIQVIEQYIPKASIGYQNRGRKVIKAIATKKIYRL